MNLPTFVIWAVNGLGIYGIQGPIGPIANDLSVAGHRVEVMAHASVRYRDDVPDVVVCHSMGCNATFAKFRNAKKKPRLIVSIDPGRAPLSHTCPKSVRCVNLYDPWHPIGGQYVTGGENYRIKGTVHITMPLVEKVRKAAVRIVKETQDGTN